MSASAAVGARRAQLTSSAPDVHGRVHVSPRVFEKALREASAQLIGVGRDALDVEVSEWSGGLAVRIETLLPVPDLDDTDAVREAPPVIQRARTFQGEAAEEFARLTGREIRRISFVVKGATVPERKRVR